MSENVNVDRDFAAKDLAKLAQAVESTYRDLRAKSIPHEHIVRAAAIVRSVNKSSVLFEHIRNGSYDLSSEHRLALCPRCSAPSGLGSVQVYVDIGEDEANPNNYVVLANQTVCEFNDSEGTAADCAVELGFKLANALGRELVLCVSETVHFDGREESISLDDSFDARELEKRGFEVVARWRESFIQYRDEWVEEIKAETAEANKSESGHIVFDARLGGVLTCLRCGDIQKPNYPISADDFAVLSESFIARHTACNPSKEHEATS